MSEPWTGRDDVQDGEAGRRWHQVVRCSPDLEAGALHLIGFASDEGVRRNQGRVGAVEGPKVLRSAMANLPVGSVSTLVDLGDVTCEDENLENSHEVYAQVAAHAIGAGRVIGFGGGHEVAYGSYLALRRAMPDSTIGILNFDAHFDLRDERRPTSGTSFLAALIEGGAKTKYAVMGISRAANTQALFFRASEFGTLIRLDEAMTGAHLAGAREELNEWLAGIDVLYMTICLDVLPASVAPGVSAPAARGVALEVLEPLIQFAAGSGKLRIADIAELNPTYDVDYRTARTAARMVWMIAESWR
ncbi:MAG: formimidoylglutamase [Fimbriimonadaceae bacterium]|nr:formimidoylglutamase [Fimbriimonadaceae bacterium]